MAAETAPQFAETERSKSKKLSALQGLLPFLLPYKALMGAAFLALILTAGVSLTLPLAVRRVVDNFGIPDDSTLDKYFAAALGIAALLALGTALRYSLVTRLGERVVADIRRAVFDRVIMMSPYFFDKILTGTCATLIVRSAIHIVGMLNVVRQTSKFVVLVPFTALVVSQAAFFRVASNNAVTHVGHD